MAVVAACSDVRGHAQEESAVGESFIAPRILLFGMGQNNSVSDSRNEGLASHGVPVNSCLGQFRDISTDRIQSHMQQHLMNATDHLFQSIHFDDLTDPDTTERMASLDENPYRVMDVLFPEQRQSDLSVFFIHGGGWRHGHRSGYHRLMRDLVAKGYVCASTDCTLYHRLSSLHSRNPFLRTIIHNGKVGHSAPFRKQPKLTPYIHCRRA
jgi:hypothetical protein